MDPQTIFFYVVLGILVLTAILEFFFRTFLKKAASRIFLYSALFVGAYLIFIGYLQFRAFQAGPLGLTLGQSDTLKWFFGYVQLHFWNQYLVSFAGGLLFFFIARYFNKKFNERFFWGEELYLASTAILLVGYPGWFFYIAALLVLATLGSAFLALRRRGERFPIYHLWIPAAIATHLFIGFWASHQGWWNTFRF